MQNSFYEKPPIVIDTNLLISAMIAPNSMIHEALYKALKEYVICVSQNTLDEFIEVARRDKFLRFIKDISGREKFISDIVNASKMIEPIYTITDCRDPKDNIILELALTCQAQYLVSGDKDLLSLHPYQGIQIITAREFLQS